VIIFGYELYIQETLEVDVERDKESAGGADDSK